MMLGRKKQLMENRHASFLGVSGTTQIQGTFVYQPPSTPPNINPTQASPEWAWVKVAQTCATLCNTVDYTLNGILQARILEWVAVPFSRGSSQHRDQTQVSRIFFTSRATNLAPNTSFQKTHSYIACPSLGLSLWRASSASVTCPAHTSGKWQSWRSGGKPDPRFLTTMFNAMPHPVSFH